MEKHKMKKKQKLILLPGWSMDSRVWCKAIPLLSEDYEVYSCDWYGLKSVEDYYQRAFSLIHEKVAPQESFSLLGWSLGSLLAIQFAFHYKAAQSQSQFQDLPQLPSHPRSQLQQIILVSGTSRFTRDRKSKYNCGLPPQIVEKMKRALTQDKEKCLHNFYISMFSEVEKEQGYDQQFMEENQINAEHYDLGTLLAGLDLLLQEDLRHVLPTLSTPLMLIQGDQDTVCPESAAAYIATHWKGPVVFHSLEGAGHMPFYTRPEDFVTVIKRHALKENHD
ncbi:alpha/beta fold hydrolase [Heliorestis convoluta]|nr:alpha/beta hydrolase [Heliorestis convoluta]